ncbi:MAG: hypothetical protein JWL59_1381 [Chthoniobacteraceae bacterium]|nr:hypothetical protein [Chthoniobacteraceae bacterium]
MAAKVKVANRLKPGARCMPKAWKNAKVPTSALRPRKNHPPYLSQRKIEVNASIAMHCGTTAKEARKR